MIFQEVATISGLGLIIIGTTSTFLYRIFKEIKSIKEESEYKRGRIYNRIDEIKDKQDINYVKKEVCEVVHKNLDEKLENIQNKTDCIPSIKSGIDLLIKKNGIK